MATALGRHQCASAGRAEPLAAVLDWAALGFGSYNGRVRMVTTLTGPGAEARVTGAYAPHARQHVDYDT